MNFFPKQGTRFIVYFLVAIATGLKQHDVPPESLAQLWEWLWLPALAGFLDAVASLGVNYVTQSKKPPSA